jgi:hypothetical protein
MRFVIAFILTLFTTQAYADNIIIGFKGKYGLFDHKAFNEFAAKRNLKPVIAHNDSRLFLINLIQNNPNYELYGYSRGAAIVSYVVRMAYENKMPMPKSVTTVGAYKSVDVDFTKYGVDFINYFDDSGRGQRSPGIFIKVPHNQIMRYVTDNF